MKITFYGHSCILIETCGKRILFDPFISFNEKAKHIDLEKLNVDYILISHGHEDHVADAETLAKMHNAVIVSNFEIVSWYQQKGIEKVWPMNHGGTKEFDFGSIKYVNAVHSSVLPDGTYGGNPGGFVLKNEEGCVYFAGDTALTMDMELLGRHMDLDLAILPIGDNFTMGVGDAIICSDMINCNKVMGVHFDTFPPIVIDHNQAVEEFKAAEKELILLEIGENIEL
ncbi:MAG: metal-dependent hydrolase [Flavobacteriales bacterium]